MSRRALLALATTVALATVVAAPAGAATVTVRVEAAGAPAPLFAGPVTTLPHPVDGGDGSGPHPCDGPAGAPPTATATGALDDAMRAAGISWRGNWDPDFRDFFIERIGAYASTAPDDYWSLTVDGRYSSGGCLAGVGEGDEVRFFYGPLFGEGPGAPGGGGGGTTGPGGRPGAGEAPVSGPAPAAPARRIAERAVRFLRRHREGAGDGWATLALDLRARSGGPRHARQHAAAPGSRRLHVPAAATPLGRRPALAAAALLGGRLGELRPDGSLGDDVNATALAVIALEAVRPRRAARAAAWLAGAQSPDGGLGFRPGVAPDVDTTGLAAWALARAGRATAARRAAAFVASAQAPDGGFPSLPGGEPDAQSTGLALVALRVGGIGARLRSSSGLTPLDYLAGLARRDGSLEYATGSRTTPVWTTAQALLGLTGRAQLLG